MDLTKLTDGPELTVPIGGRMYAFSELPLEHLEKLQAFIRKTVPHPLESVKPHLDGLSLEDRQYVLEQARIEAKSWPPQVGTSTGAIALLSSEPGQIESLYVGLLAHQPDTTRDDATRIYKALRKQVAKEAAAAKKKGLKYAGDGTVRRIFACLFGLEPDDGDEDAPPKE